MNNNSHSQATFIFDRFEMRPTERLLTSGGKILHLTPRVYDLLEMLVRNSGAVVTKEEILEQVWAGTVVEEGNVNRTVSTIRRHLGTQVNGNDFIETVPKVGYRFVASVTQEDHTPAPNALPAEEHAPSPAAGGRFKLVYLAAATVGLLALLAVVLYLVNRTPASTSAAPGAGPSITRLTSGKENEQVAGCLSDGRIAVTRWKDANTPETWFVAKDGTGLTKAAGPADLRQGVWSPDLSRVIFWKYSDNGAGAYLANADGTKETKLSFAAYNPAWSPDGGRIAFQSAADGARSEVSVYTISDEKIVQLTSNSVFDGDPGWSPDGKHLAFVSDRDGNYEIYSMKADGTEPKRLTNNPGHDSFPKFAPDGTQIAFNSNLDSEKTDIYVMSVEGGAPVRITDWKSNELTRSGWSPDGTQIAFNSDRDGNDDVYVMNVEPFARRLLIEAADAELQTPAYSPDGKLIAYSAEFVDKHSELRIYDVAARTSRTVLRTSSGQNYPQWSPDGAWIAFHQEVGGKWDIFKIKPDGTGLTNLSNDPSSDSLPTWSADGRSIYFRSNRNGDTETSEVFRMDADGSGVAPLPIAKGRLGWPGASFTAPEIVLAAERSGSAETMFDIFVSRTDAPGESLLVALPKNDIQPTFSRDGQSIAFVAARDGNPEIYVIRRDGTGLLRITRDTADDLYPSFSPDGGTLLFSSARGERKAIYEVSIPR